MAAHVMLVPRARLAIDFPRKSLSVTIEHCRSRQDSARMSAWYSKPLARIGEEMRPPQSAVRPGAQCATLRHPHASQHRAITALPSEYFHGT